MCMAKRCLHYIDMLLAQLYFLEAMIHYFQFPDLFDKVVWTQLAPFLSILSGEALSSFLRSLTAVIQAIALPISKSIVLDVEFADDTTLYIRGDVIDLDRIHMLCKYFHMLLGLLSIGIHL